MWKDGGKFIGFDSHFYVQWKSVSLKEAIFKVVEIYYYFVKKPHSSFSSDVFFRSTNLNWIALNMKVPFSPSVWLVMCFGGATWYCTEILCWPSGLYWMSVCLIGSWSIWTLEGFLKSLPIASNTQVEKAACLSKSGRYCSQIFKSGLNLMRE